MPVCNRWPCASNTRPIECRLTPNKPSALRRKNRALVYYLAAHAQPLTREQVLIFFWPDHDHAAAQQILRTMLFDLRKILGEALVVDDETLALSAETFVDARTFEAHLGLTICNGPIPRQSVG